MVVVYCSVSQAPCVVVVYCSVSQAPCVVVMYCSVSQASCVVMYCSVSQASCVVVMFAGTNLQTWPVCLAWRVSSGLDSITSYLLARLTEDRPHCSYLWLPNSPLNIATCLTHFQLTITVASLRLGLHNRQIILVLNKLSPDSDSELLSPELFSYK